MHPESGGKGRHGHAGVCVCVCVLQSLPAITLLGAAANVSVCTSLASSQASEPWLRGASGSSAGCLGLRCTAEFAGQAATSQADAQFDLVFMVLLLSFRVVSLQTAHNSFSKHACHSLVSGRSSSFSETAMAGWA